MGEASKRGQGDERVSLTFLHRRHWDEQNIGNLSEDVFRSLRSLNFACII
jgi:hypothetical protein